MKASVADMIAFDRACAELRRLTDKGLTVYLANDTLCLMSGPSHDEHHRPRQDRIITSHSIGGSGGDW